MTVHVFVAVTVPTMYALLNTPLDDESDYSEEVVSAVRTTSMSMVFCISVEGVQEGKVLMILKKQFTWY